MNLADKRIGALIVLERDILLSRYVEIGIHVDAKVSKEILLAIFHPSSPVHDGAVIIQKGRIASAGCFLPLTRDEDIDLNLGTRHRAAIGISQETDALVIVVSEEGASMALVERGRISRKADAKSLKNDLLRILIPDIESPQPKSAIERMQITSPISRVRNFVRKVARGRSP
ncbi:MAG: DNA integrity scanning protein DisA nucleotide-binding domain protein [Proteobacteria bacterium]|nr:DNA integrity scanning protein DisA nucleotide-binding domain protein [Pseudomonadota bacterium]